MERLVAYILINVDAGMERSVIDEILSRFKGSVTEARVTYGEYDIVVRVEADSLRALDFVVAGIRAIKGVRRAITLLAS